MLRSILAVIAGYFVMFVIIFVTFSMAYLSMGADRAFREGSYEVSWFWIVISILLGTFAALAGGMVCRLIALSMTPVYVLAGLVLVLGILTAIPAFTADPPEARTAEVGNLDAMAEARTPPMVALLNPLIGAVGAIVGGLLIDRGRRHAIE